MRHLCSLRQFWRFFAVVVAVGLHAAASAPVQAIVLTGKLSDFGVNRGGVPGQVYTGVGNDFPNLAPFVDRHTDGHGNLPIYHIGVGSDVSYTIWDTRGPFGSGRIPAGGPDYDVRAMYMTNDHQNLYIGIVTSFNPAGVGPFRVGDIAINPNPNPTGVLNPPPAGLFFDFDQYVTQPPGYNTRSSNPNQILSQGADWGILLPTGPAGTSGWTDIIADGDWRVIHPSGSGGFNPPPYSDVIPTTGSKIVNGAFFRYDQLDFYYQRPGGGTAPVYLIEVSVPLNLLVGLTPQVTAAWTMSCTNDYMGVRHIIPEPHTLVLVGVGLCMGGWFLQRKRRRNAKAAESI
ncbi:MAG: PEP-CTERM sorting domain-containing protein [Abditibacteriales bacterium]|nr:PEP-CTERM sorting domain-containing protein [Abditibacteriales bacterium]MDW8365512.1 PEP-CTERM sorting domain-containing protein [Abditibacteriales bacterium]